MVSFNVILASISLGDTNLSLLFLQGILELDQPSGSHRPVLRSWHSARGNHVVSINPNVCMIMRSGG
jgi:hypothetical protein